MAVFQVFSRRLNTCPSPIVQRLSDNPQQNKHLPLLRKLASDVPGVQAASNCRVGRAFDDGTAIGEQGHFVGIVPEPQHEVIVPDHAVGLEAAIHLREIDGPLVLVNLHGVAPALLPRDE